MSEHDPHSPDLGATGQAVLASVGAAVEVEAGELEVAEPEAPRGPGAVAYRRRADQIAAMLIDGRGQPNRQEGLAQARRELLEKKGGSQQMQAFTKVLLDAPLAFEVGQDELKARRDVVAMPALRQAEVYRLQERRAKLSLQVATYKAALTEAIIASDGAIDRERMTDWLSKTSGQEKWVRSVLMPEVAARVAAYRYFSQRDGVKTVTMAPAQETIPSHWRYRDDWQMEVEVKGADPIKVAGRPFGQEPEGNVAFGRSGILEVGLPIAILSGFDVDEAAKDVFDKQIDVAMHKRSEGSTHAYTSERSD